MEETATFEVFNKKKHAYYVITSENVISDHCPKIAWQAKQQKILTNESVLKVDCEQILNKHIPGVGFVETMRTTMINNRLRQGNHLLLTSSGHQSLG